MTDLETRFERNVDRSGEHHRADHLAVSLGMHPVEVWTNWYEVDTAA